MGDVKHDGRYLLLTIEPSQGLPVRPSIVLVGVFSESVAFGTVLVHDRAWKMKR